MYKIIIIISKSNKKEVSNKQENNTLQMVYCGSCCCCCSCYIVHTFRKDVQDNTITQCLLLGTRKSHVICTTRNIIIFILLVQRFVTSIYVHTMFSLHNSPNSVCSVLDANYFQASGTPCVGFLVIQRPTRRSPVYNNCVPITRTSSLSPDSSE